MQQVLGGGARKEGSKVQRKRDQKHLHKATVKLQKAAQNPEQDCDAPHRTVEIKTQSNAEMADLVFRPPSTVFKGETPCVAVDCEMVETDRLNDGLAR
jgi:hypothetical protein